MNYHAPEDLFQPALIHSVNGLALISRQIVDTYLSGVNHSQRTGWGMEFSQYRKYEPGDDLRMLDWKLVARRERYYVRQSEIESATTINFILDATASMNQEYKGTSKIDYARVIIATLAYLGGKQGDAAGLYAINEDTIVSLNPDRRRQQYLQLLNKLVSFDATGQWPENKVSFHELIPRKEKSLTIFISDFYSINNLLINNILELNNSSNDIICIHIASPLDTRAEFNGDVTLEDLETGERIEFTSLAKADYQERWEAFQESIKHRLLENHLRYFLIDMGDPLPFQLKNLLNQTGGL